MLLFWNFLKSGKFFLGGGGQKKKSCSECAETCSRFAIFEIWQIFFLDGVKKKKVVQNVLKHALVLDFLKSGKKNFGGVKKKKVFQNVLKQALVLEFLKSGKKNFVCEKVYRQTDRHHSENIRRSA